MLKGTQQLKVRQQHAERRRQAAAFAPVKLLDRETILLPTVDSRAASYFPATVTIRDGLGRRVVI